MVPPAEPPCASPMPPPFGNALEPSVEDLDTLVASVSLRAVVAEAAAGAVAPIVARALGRIEELLAAGLQVLPPEAADDGLAVGLAQRRGNRVVTFTSASSSLQLQQRPTPEPLDAADAAVPSERNWTPKACFVSGAFSAKNHLVGRDTSTICADAIVLSDRSLSSKVSCSASPVGPLSPARKPSKNTVTSVNTVRSEVSKSTVTSGMTNLSDEDEVESFELLGHWNSRSATEVKGLSLRMRETRHKGGVFRQSVSNDDVDGLLLDGSGPCFMMPPNSLKCVAWQGLGFACIVYDLLFASVVFFDPPKSDFGVVMSWITQIFWNCDIIMSFMTGYEVEGGVVLDPYSVSVRYAKTWLPFDLIIVSVDWAMRVASETTALARNARFIKLARFLRCMRALRVLTIFKFEDIRARIEEIFKSDLASAQASMSKAMLAIVFIAHFSACAWFAVGSSASDGSGWVDRFQMDNASFTYQYTTSYHWSMAQLGMGSTSIEAGNVQERVYSVCFLLCSLCVFSSVISAATNAMATLQQSAAESNRQTAAFSRFCRRNQIPARVRRRALRFLEKEHAIVQQNHDVAHVELFPKLTGPMQAELLFHANVAHFKSSPMLRILSERAPASMRLVSAEAVSTDFFATADRVFNAGEVAQKVLCVATGALRYSTRNETLVLGVPQWVAEPALWMKWCYRGDLRAKTESRLVTVDAQRFGATLRAHDPDVWDTAAQYAKDFVAELNSLSRQGRRELSDISPARRPNSQAMLAWARHLSMPSILRGTYLPA